MYRCTIHVNGMNVFVIDLVSLVFCFNMIFIVHDFKNFQYNFISCGKFLPSLFWLSLQNLVFIFLTCRFWLRITWFLIESPRFTSLISMETCDDNFFQNLIFDSWWNLHNVLNERKVVDHFSKMVVEFFLFYFMKGKKCVRRILWTTSNFSLIMLS